jgi:NADPH-dependent curcumin reductase CurA
MEDTMPSTFRQWVYARPMQDDVVDAGCFALQDMPLPALAHGQALVRVKLINIHSNTRMRMALGAIPLGHTDPANYACAEVVETRDPSFRVGDVIACQAGWQDYAIVSSRDAAIGYGPATDATKALNRTNSQWTYVFRPSLVQAYTPDILMDVFGTSGMTAWFGMQQCGPILPSETVLVAGVTGSVGSLAAQIARAAGARVVGLAGSPAKCAWAKQTLGIADCVDYRGDGLADRIRAAAPSGIDVFSDGAGGDLTKIVVSSMNERGRLFSYGMTSSFYASRLNRPTGKRPLRQTFGISDEVESLLAARNIRSECWIVDSFYDQRLAAEDGLAQLMSSGALKPINTVVDGFERLPEAIASLYKTQSSGKLQVRFA